MGFDYLKQVEICNFLMRKSYTWFETESGAVCIIKARNGKATSAYGAYSWDVEWEYKGEARLVMDAALKDWLCSELGKRWEVLANNASLWGYFDALDVQDHQQAIAYLEEIENSL